MKYISYMFKKYLNKLIYFAKKRAAAEIWPTNTLNHKWRDSLRGRKITVRKEKVLNKHSKVFALGSCFAVEIRNALRALGYDVYPKYLSIKFDQNKQRIGSIPVRDNINHYDTFVIKQEIERSLSKEHYDANYFWQLKNSKINKILNSDTIYQDPFRRHIYATDSDSIINASRSIDTCIDEGLDKSDIIIITLGLTEVWQQKQSGLYICQGPGNVDDEIFNWVEPYLSNFEDNYKNIYSIVEKLTSIYPDKKIILTVSPVALNQTFTQSDIVVANMQSKTTLRVVAGEIQRLFKNVIYWPSYEFALAEDIFREDGRHVKPENVQRIIQSFIDTYS